MYSDDHPADGERRSEWRGATVFRPVLIETDGFAGFCLVRNLSSNGMKAKVYTSLPSNEPITVRFSSDEDINGRVIWCEGDQIGVRFERCIDVQHVLERLAKREVGAVLNRPLRLPMSASGELLIEGQSVAFELQDISQKGLKVTAEARLRVSEELITRLPGMEQRKAIVRWSQAGAAGLNFLRPLSFDELAQWVVEQQM